MGGIWAIGELVEGRPTRLALELASLAVDLATQAGGEASVVLVAGDEAAAAELAQHGPAVLAAAGTGSEAPEPRDVAVVAARLIEDRSPDIVLVGASPDGRDVAGMLVGLTELPILVAATGVSLRDGSITVDMATFGGRLLTSSAFTAGRGIILVRPGTRAAEPAATAGAIEHVEVTPIEAPAVTVVDRVAAAPAGPSIEDARVIVGAGRGVGGPEGLAIVEQLADALDGAVGATRAAVDSGWIDFAQQIGQTGKSVKPELYIACGISGAIQHKVGVQSAGTIVAINKDADAPITEFADLVVIGDIFEVVPRLTQAIRDARGESA